MSDLPDCPSCRGRLTYLDGALFVCPECGHEWFDATESAAPDAAPGTVRDAHGNVLADGDTVLVVKDLKLRGGGGVLKMGTKVKNIRLVEGDHDIDCRIEGFGAMALKSEFVRKVTG
jgi:protein PhnA